MKFIFVIAMTLTSAAFAQQTQPSEQEQIVNYVTVVCSAKSEIEQKLAAQGADTVQEIITAKDQEIQFWTTEAVPAIEKSLVIFKQGKAEIEKAESQDIVNAGYQACYMYAQMQPIMVAMNSVGMKCVDSQDKAVDFTAVEKACTEVFAAISAAYPQ